MYRRQSHSAQSVPRRWCACAALTCPHVQVLARPLGDDGTAGGGGGASGSVEPSSSGVERSSDNVNTDPHRLADAHGRN
jgi:hypothetical protein